MLRRHFAFLGLRAPQLRITDSRVLVPYRSYGFFGDVWKNVREDAELKRVKDSLTDRRIEKHGGSYDESWHPKPGRWRAWYRMHTSTFHGIRAVTRSIYGDLTRPYTSKIRRFVAPPPLYEPGDVPEDVLSKRDTSDPVQAPVLERVPLGAKISVYPLLSHQKRMRRIGYFNYEVTVQEALEYAREIERLAMNKKGGEALKAMLAEGKANSDADYAAHREEYEAAEREAAELMRDPNFVEDMQELNELQRQDDALEELEDLEAVEWREELRLEREWSKADEYSEKYDIWRACTEDYYNKLEAKIESMKQRHKERQKEGEQETAFKMQPKVVPAGIVGSKPADKEIKRKLGTASRAAQPLLSEMLPEERAQEEARLLKLKEYEVPLQDTLKEFDALATDARQRHIEAAKQMLQQKQDELARRRDALAQAASAAVAAQSSGDDDTELAFAHTIRHTLDRVGVALSVQSSRAGSRLSESISPALQVEKLRAGRDAKILKARAKRKAQSQKDVTSEVVLFLEEERKARMEYMKMKEREQAEALAKKDAEALQASRQLAAAKAAAAEAARAAALQAGGDAAAAQEAAMAAEEAVQAEAEKPPVTALVAGPAPTAWEAAKERFKLRPKQSKAYQSLLEFKEQLEDSQNPLVAKTMDTLGAAADVTAAAAKKVFGARSAHGVNGRVWTDEIRKVVPGFELTNFEAMVRPLLKPIAKVFHKMDILKIAKLAAPERFHILEAKAREVCKSAVDPTKLYFAFILRTSQHMHVYRSLMQEPDRPIIMVKFKMQKTAERVDPATGRLGEGRKGMKIVQSEFVLAFQWDPVSAMWRVYDFHEAKFDLAFF